MVGGILIGTGSMYVDTRINGSWSESFNNNNRHSAVGMCYASVTVVYDYGVMNGSISYCICRFDFSW